MRPIALLVLLMTFARAGDAPALPVAVAADDPNVRYSGRWDRRDAGGPRCEWPACAVHLVVDGGPVNVVLGGLAEHAFQVVVDGEPTSVITLVDGQTVYPVVPSLAPGRHTIELCKRTECWRLPVQVRGFQLGAGVALAPPTAPTRRIEFLGDSITCGYGNEAKSQDERFSYATENAWLAWGAIAARRLAADYSCVAMSGIWLQQDGENRPLPTFWESTMPLTDPTPWDFSRWQADAVVVNLGTNDSGKPIDRARWTEAYRAFIARIRAVYPAAHIFLVIGPMGHGPDRVIPIYNEEIVASARAAGDTRIHALALPDQDGADGIGADWHPSVATHRGMAERIAAAIRDELGW
ncbi:MAG TPA: SGNH/GDSL hydrolase family protein [Planctomycetota bacterium]|nr:SGNH/GDSL hydrolase family protein [Planctomycetota bacterium]